MIIKLFPGALWVSKPLVTDLERFLAKIWFDVRGKLGDLLIE
jgi:hypothetical protein